MMPDINPRPDERGVMWCSREECPQCGWYRCKLADTPLSGVCEPWVWRLLGALQDLMDVQNGPPLITSRSAWTDAMAKCYAATEGTIK